MTTNKIFTKSKVGYLCYGIYSKEEYIYFRTHDDPRYCACGCNILIIPKDNPHFKKSGHSRGYQIYVTGHNFKNVCGKYHPNYGVKLKESHILKIIKRMNKPENIKNLMKGKKKYELENIKEISKRNSIQRINYFKNNPKECIKEGNRLQKEYKKWAKNNPNKVNEHLIKMRESQQFKFTKIELKIIKYIKHFINEYMLHIVGISGTPDIVIPNSQLPTPKGCGLVS